MINFSNIGLADGEKCAECSGKPVLNLDGVNFCFFHYCRQCGYLPSEERAALVRLANQYCIPAAKELLHPIAT